MPLRHEGIAVGRLIMINDLHWNMLIWAAFETVRYAGGIGEWPYEWIADD